jgi:3-methyl-2-oxobutanoate hydroxymethyltransferase
VQGGRREGQKVKKKAFFFVVCLNSCNFASDFKNRQKKMGYLSTDKKKITTKTFAEMKQAGEKVTMLTAYDFTTAGIIDSAGIDSILIGDSASNVMAGNANTLPISVDEMIYHARSVTRAVNHALVVCDMPFGSYQISREEALRNACRMMKETGVDALKLEGGIEIIDTVKSLIDAGIPVHGHLGLTPQSVNKFGGYGIRAKEEAEAEKLISDAIALDKAGCFAIVLEKVPAKLAAEVTRQVKAVTIGIGAGAGCDGQVLVYADALGMTQGFKPKFLRHFAHVGKEITKGVQSYVDAVKTGGYPSAEESY